MKDWGWKIFFVLFILFVLIPSRLEIDFAANFYHSNPRLCLLLVACAVAGVGVAWWLRHSRGEKQI